MPLLARMVAAPLTVDIRRGAIEGLAALLADGRISTKGRVAIAVGPGQGEELARVLHPQLRDADIFSVNGGTIDAARNLADRLRVSFYDAVVGVGGGRTLDVAKYAASLVGLPMVAVATNLAHDGLASPVASLEHGGRKGSYGVAVPIAVIVDLDYVRHSPERQVRSGIGDAISNLNALADWRLARRIRGEAMDGLAAAFANCAAESLLDREDSIESDTFLTTLAEALVLSGLAMAVAGTSRPCSGGCHEISHAIDDLYPGVATHGEQVAVGAMFACYLRDDPLATRIDACLRRHGVPRVPRELGLSGEQFAAAVSRAPATRPDRYTILEHLSLDEDEIRKRVHGFIETFDR